MARPENPTKACRLMVLHNFVKTKTQTSTPVAAKHWPSAVKKIMDKLERHAEETKGLAQPSNTAYAEEKD